MKDSEMSREQLEQEFHRLRTSHDFLDRIVNGMFEALMVIDPEYKIKDINSCFIEKYGKSREELIGHTCYEVTHQSTHPCTTENHECPLQEVIKNRATVKTEHIHKDKEGNELIVEIYCFPLLDEAGNVDHVVEVQHDITEQRRARKAIEQREQRFKEFFENQPDYCYIISPEKTILDVNHVACKTLGYTWGQLVGKPLDIIYAPECHQKMNNVFTKWVKNRKIKDEEMVIITRNGERRNVLLNANAVTDEQGNIIHSVSVQKDVTLIREAENRLKDSEAKYRSLVDNSGSGVLAVDTKGIITFMNNTFGKLTGYMKQELIGKSVTSVLHPDDVKNIIRLFQKSFTDPSEVVHLEYRLVHKNGHMVHAASSPTAILRDGEIIGFQAIAQDISERKKTEEALANEATRRRILIEQSRDGIVILDEDGAVYEANRQFAEMLGYSPEEVKQLYVWDWEFKFPHEQVREMLRSVDESGDHFETVHRRKDGTIYDVEISTNGAIYEGQKLIFCVCRDITKRKQAEQALAESEEKFRNLVEKANDGVCIIQDGIVEYANPMLAQLWGGAPEEIIGASFKDFIHEDDIQFVAERYLRRIAGENVIETYEARLLNKRSETLHTELSSGLITYKGKPAVMSIVRDITERMKTETALRESEERYRVLIENASQSIMVIEGGIVKFANSKSYELHGYTVDEMNSMPLENFIHPDDREMFIKRRTQRVKGSPITGEHTFRIITKDGRTVWVSRYVTSITWEGKSAVLVFDRDITERKRIEDELKLRAQLLDNANDGISVRDMEGNFVYVNEMASNLTGYSREELLTMSLYDIVPPEYHENVVEATTGGEKTFETSLLCKDGTRIPVEVRTKIIELDGNKYIIGASRDITERKKAEQELKLRTQLLDSAYDAIYIYDLQGNIFYANEAAYKSRGYTKEEFVNHNLYELVTPELAQLIKQHIKDIAEKGSDSFKGMHMRKDGSLFPVEIHGSLIEVEGQTLGISIARDITERQQFEDELKLRAQLLDNANDAISVRDKNNNYIYANEIAYRTLGYTKEEFLKMNLNDLVSPEYRGKVNGIIDETLRKGEHEYEMVIMHKDGSPVHVETRARLVKLFSTEYIISVSRDITERIAIEQELKLRAQLLDNANDSLFVMDIDGNFIYVNEAAYKTRGYTREELMKLNLGDLPPPKYSERAMQRLKSLPQKGESLYEALHQRKDGSTMPVELHSRWITIGDSSYIVSIARDMTERKTAEESLKESEAKYRLLFNSSNDAAFVDRPRTHGGPGQFIEVNDIACSMLGYSRDELLKLTIEDITERDKNYLSSEKAARATLEREKTALFERTYVAKNGRHIPVEINAHMFEYEGLPAVLTIARDITERKRMEEELIRAQKLESVGTLAGGIAHDFNNILTGILGYITLAKNQTKSGDKISDMLIEAEKASLRAKDLTQQLLTFARGGAPVRKITSIAHVLKDTATFAVRGSDVKCQFSIPSDLRQVNIDAGQISQVINNLVLNADQAMPQGGTIIITAQNVTITPKQRLSLKPGDYIKISVEDQGLGIPSEHLPRIFDPYFTTKQKGSGLGLATSYSIVKNHGGTILAVSKVGVGSTFHVYLPTSTERTIEEKIPRTQKPAGKGKILVMDDEKVVREVCGRVLNHIGYQEVAFASDGAEAIKLYKQAYKSGNPFDAVIMDLTIPGGMGGKEAIKQLLRLYPDAKVIVSSGYASDPVMADYKKYGFKGVVTKPFTLEQMGEVLSSIL